MLRKQRQIMQVARLCEHFFSFGACTSSAETILHEHIYNCRSLGNICIILLSLEGVYILDDNEPLRHYANLITNLSFLLKWIFLFHFTLLANHKWIRISLKRWNELSDFSKSKSVEHWTGAFPEIFMSHCNNAFKVKVKHVFLDVSDVDIYRKFQLGCCTLSLSVVVNLVSILDVSLNTQHVYAFWQSTNTFSLTFPDTWCQVSTCILR